MLMPVVVRAAVVCDHINMQVYVESSCVVRFALCESRTMIFLKTSVVACADKSSVVQPCDVHIGFPKGLGHRLFLKMFGMCHVVLGLGEVYNWSPRMPSPRV
jgi:hypothetical protein